MPSDEVKKLREDADKWVEKHGPSGIFGVFPNRSCWNCNPAHEWMKNDIDTPYECFVCGEIYFKGVQISSEDAP